MNILDLSSSSIAQRRPRRPRVLDSLTLSIRAGEHTAILGPNGAGKSTLMKLLALEQYPLPGENGVSPIRVFGQDRWDVFELRSQLGIVSADLHDRFTRGNTRGAITGRTPSCPGFFASQGLFANHRVSGRHAARGAATRSRRWAWRISRMRRSIRCPRAKRAAC